MTKKVTYVFSKNRKNLLSSDAAFAKEFFYGFTEFDKKHFDLEIVEFKEKNKFFIFFEKFDHILSKYLSLPIYFSKLINFNNLKIFLKSDEIYFINEGVGFSSLPLIFIVNIFKKNKKKLFVMGMYSKQIKYKKLYFLHKMFINILVSQVDYILFLGKGEYHKAQKFHKHKYHGKLKFTPFLIDFEFWKSDNYEIANKNELLFVGNDGNRDYELLLKLAKKLKDIKFKFVTSNKKVLDCNLENVEVIKGDWSQNNLSDQQLKKIYQSCRMSIIPLKDTTQPSGQSVALQSMAVGLPVLISKTEGFWDIQKFDDEKNIFFVDDNDLNSWIKKINDVFHDNKRLENVAKNASNLIRDEYSLEKNFSFIKNI